MSVDCEFFSKCINDLRKMPLPSHEHFKRAMESMRESKNVKPSAFASCYPQGEEWKAGFYTPVGFFAPSKGESKQEFLAFIDKLATFDAPMAAYHAMTPVKMPSIQS